MNWVYISIAVIILLILAYNHKKATEKVMAFIKGIVDWVKSVKDILFG